jgi:hypothetical protein
MFPAPAQTLTGFSGPCASVDSPTSRSLLAATPVNRGAHWAKHRPATDLTNLVLLCYRHRWLLHRGLMADVVSKCRPMRRMPSARSLVPRKAFRRARLCLGHWLACHGATWSIWGRPANTARERDPLARDRARSRGGDESGERVGVGAVQGFHQDAASDERLR